MEYPTKMALAGLSKMLLIEEEGVDSMMKTRGKKSNLYERNINYCSVTIVELIIVRKPLSQWHAFQQYTSTCVSTHLLALSLRSVSRTEEYATATLLHLSYN